MTSVNKMQANHAAVAARINKSNEINTSESSTKFSSAFSSATLSDENASTNAAHDTHHLSRVHSDHVANAPTPHWYGQFGAMTRWVPAQYLDSSYVMPELPPKVQASTHDILTGKSTASHGVGGSSYHAKLMQVKDTLDVNFATLPQSVQDAATAARNEYFASLTKNLPVVSGMPASL